MSDNWKMQDDDASMPIGTGSENAPSEIAFPEEKKAKVSGMTLILVLVFIGGLGLIYLLGMQNKVKTADASQTATETQINTALESLATKTDGGKNLNKLFADTDRLVKMFYEYPGKASLPLEDLPTNPFEHPSASRATAILDPIVPQGNGNAAAAERARKLAESFGQLKLQSVMVSSGFGMAQINGKLVKVGAKVGEFTVDSIESKRVIVKADDQKFELLLNQPKLDENPQ